MLLALLATLRLSLARRLHLENIDQVRPGMTQPQVEELLGGPPGYYRPPDQFNTVAFPIGSHGWPPPAWVSDRRAGWYGEDAQAVVYFDKGGRVSHVEWARAGVNWQAIPWQNRVRYYLRVLAMQAPPD